MNIQFATKKVDSGYEAALIIDGKFKRSGAAPSVSDLFVKLCGPILAVDQRDGAEVAVNVTIMTAEEVERMDLREARARQTAEADAEATELEKLNVAVAREQKARQQSEMLVNGTE